MSISRETFDGFEDRLYYRRDATGLHFTVYLWRHRIPVLSAVARTLVSKPTYAESVPWPFDDELSLGVARQQPGFALGAIFVRSEYLCVGQHGSDGRADGTFEPFRRTDPLPCQHLDPPLIVDAASMNLPTYHPKRRWKTKHDRDE